MKKHLCALLITTPIAAMASDWTYKEVRDDFENETTKTAVLESDGEVIVDRSGKKSKARLYLTPLADGTTGVAISIPTGQLICIEPCDIRAKFGDSDIMLFKAVRPADLSSDYVLLRNGSLFADWLIKRKSAFVQLTVYQVGQQTLQFSPKSAPKLD